MSNVQETNLEPRALDLDDAAEAILGRWSDGEDLSDDEELEASEEDIDETDGSEEYEEDDQVEEDEEDSETDPDEDEEETEDEDEDTEEDDDEEDETSVEDLMVDVSVDGETKQVSVKDLKRLYGQEAALTRKSQEVAAKRKEAETALGKADASYQKLLERAEARWKPYADIDMLVASKNLSSEDFAQLRQDAKAAEEDLKFLREEADSFYQANQQAFKEQLASAAKECVRVLEQDIEGWGNDLYNEIRSYAVKNGLPQEQVDQYVDPNVIKILNKARLYDQLKVTAESKKVKAKMTKTKASNSKPLRSKKAPPTQADVNYSKQKKTVQKLRQNKSRAGDLDDIADALMARWER